ncbi:MAG: nucleotidyltransferase domain-containing protein [FCB group bacterium]|jgi:predicted nucleotidyltransferase|nr:nucleotidyltransferase domain-containing protein [FCB group bacterium]
MSKSRLYIPENSLALFCRKWKIEELSLFGSTLTDEFGPDSDVDVLIDFGGDADWSLYDWLEMKGELEALFGRRVDLVAREELRNPFRRYAVLSSREVIYAS